MKFVPYPYQQYCIDSIIYNRAVGLFLDMGLGKTVITLTAIHDLRYNRWEVSKPLIIAPKKVAEATWTTEAKKWEHLKMMRVVPVLGTAQQRIRALATPADVYVVNRENVQWLVEHFKNAWPFDMVVLDESSSFKNSQSKRFKSLKLVRSRIKRIVELTGITDELLREEGIGKQAFAELLAALLTPGTMLAAYNAQFDLLFLYSFLQKYGDARLLQDKPKLDLLTVYRDRRAYPHRLCNAIEQYDLQDRVTNSHRAIDDVRATVEVLRAMGTERDDLERYVDLFGYSSKYGISGPRISSVRYLPQGYEPKAAPLYAGL